MKIKIKSLVHKVIGSFKLPISSTIIDMNFFFFFAKNIIDMN